MTIVHSLLVLSSSTKLDRQMMTFVDLYVNLTIDLYLVWRNLYWLMESTFFGMSKIWLAPVGEPNRLARPSELLVARADAARQGEASYAQNQADPLSTTIISPTVS